MKIERIAISKLTSDPNNARTHDQRNLDAIAGSLREFGQRKPIVITQDNIIAAGNGTVEAAKSLGWTDIEAVRVPADWDADRIKAFALADNRTAELAVWNSEQLDQQINDLQIIDFDLSAIGFDLTNDYDSADWSSLQNAVKEKSDFQQMTFVLSEMQADLVTQAIALAKSKKPAGDGLNQNSNGNALQLIVEKYLNHGS